MSPKAFAAALRTFAAAVALSPEPAKSIAELAELLALRADAQQGFNDALAKTFAKLFSAAPPAVQESFVTPALAYITGESDTMPELDIEMMFGRVGGDAEPSPFDHDDMAFPPMERVERTAAEIEGDIASARAYLASGMSLADWNALPDCDRAHHIAVHQQLAAKAADTANPPA